MSNETDLSKLAINENVGGKPLSDIDASKLTITKVENPRDYTTGQTLKVGSLTQHMIYIEYDGEKGWHNPTIIPTSDLKLDPTSIVLHYSVSCFEGMKAYKGKDGKPRFFRPMENMARLNRSSARTDLPTFNGEEFLKVMDEWMKLEPDFVPEGDMVYVRPNHIGTTSASGGAGLKKSILYCFATRIRPAVDYDGDFKPLKLYSNNSATQVRAWPGGIGSHKLGANYGPTGVAEAQCVAEGYDQTFWLYGENNIVTEAGGSNFFAIWINDEGEKEAVTCPLDTDLILPGITRKSIIDLLKTRDDINLNETVFTVNDLIEKSKQGKLVEAFVCGTYFMVTPVGLIRAPSGEKIEIPTTVDGKWGEVTKDLYAELKAIQWGEKEHEWSHIC